MGQPPHGVDPADHALRFVLAQPISSALVGTTDLGHLRAALASAARGRHGDDAAALAREAFRRNDHGWDGVIAS